jgi:hypothetical protein
MRLRPSWRQPRWQRARIEMSTGNGGGEGPNHFYRRVGGEDLEQPAFAQLFPIAQKFGRERSEPRRRQPLRVIVGLIDHMVRGFG